jgi:hypothetical protein
VTGSENGKVANAQDEEYNTQISYTIRYLETVLA